MNKEELLLNNINDILEGIKSMAVSANAELPAIFDEIVRWGVASNLMGSFLFIGLLLLFIVLMRLIIKSNKVDWEVKGSLAVMVAALFFGPFLFLWDSIYDLALVLTSPKLYVIQYLKGLLG